MLTLAVEAVFTDQPLLVAQGLRGSSQMGLPQDWGAGRDRRLRVCIACWVEFLSEAGAECVIVDGTAYRPERMKRPDLTDETIQARRCTSKKLFADVRRAVRWRRGGSGAGKGWR
jgi:hypothetical protein